MYRRISNPLKSNSFFLFGPRGTGKTSLLKDIFSKESAFWINFLDDELFRQLSTHPAQFEGLILQNCKPGGWVVCDEIQRVPGLLNYVHKLIEEKNIKFALTGSSARKLKRGGANLLAGRAFLNHLHPLTTRELGDDFNLVDALNWGSLPRLFSLETVEEKKEFLRSYVASYVRQEIREEQVVRQVDPFLRFLEVAAQHNSKIVNASKIGRNSLTDTKAVLRYFEILQDTLMGFYLEPFHTSVRKIQSAKSKFYFFDLGVKRAIEGSLNSILSPGTYSYGEAFEHFIILECLRLKDYLRSDDRFYYLRTKDDVEIDLIIQRSPQEIWAVEIKSSTRVDDVEIRKPEKLMEDLGAKRHIVVTQESTARRIGKIEILPWAQFLNELYPEN
jgi:predicted AAA+ superfamily ATPase